MGIEFSAAQLTIMLGVVVSFFTIVSFLWRGVAVLIAMRDDFRGVAMKLGQKHPPEGLLGDVEEIKEKVDKHGEKLVFIEASVAQRRKADGEKRE